MSDSRVIDFYFNNPYWKDAGGGYWLPNIGDTYSKGGLIIENGVPTKLNSMTEKAYGLTKAANAVKAIFDEQVPFQVVGYNGSFNTPVSLLGFNGLMENLVYLSAVADKLILQKLMLQKGSDPDVVRKLSLKNAMFKSVTLTYLFRFDSYSDAVDALEEFQHHADMVLCDHTPGPSLNKRQSKKKNVVPTGAKPEITIYINKNSNFAVKAYIKAAKYGKAKSFFDSKSAENAAYAESSHYVRIEVTLGPDWLARNQLQCPLAWKKEAGPLAYEKVLNELRSMIRVDHKWRENLPQQRHLDNLSEEARDVLQDHFDGKSQYSIGSLIYSLSDIPKRIRNEIWNQLDIDIEIPWAVQAKQASNNVGTWLKWAGAFQAPQHLLKYCYVRPIVKQKIDDLKAEVEQLMHPAPTFKKKGSSTRSTKWSKAINRISSHLKAINGGYDDDSNETSDIADLME